MLLSDAINGYLLDAKSRRLSPNTLRDYGNTFHKFVLLMGSTAEFEAITIPDIRQFLASHPQVKSKTIRNYHCALSALWQWAKLEGIVPVNIIRDVKAPRADSRVIVPFTVPEIRAMLRAAVKTTGIYSGKEVRVKLVNAARNKAVVLLLLDTGLRASELCNAKIEDCDLQESRIKVFGKGRKERIVEFSPITGRAIWRYLAERKGCTKEDWLFLTDEGHKMRRTSLRLLIGRIGERAGVKGAHPHRWRHTFAVMALINGMDAFTLQSSLGHSSMDIVGRYLNVAQVDTGRIQRRASPVAGLGS